MDAWWLVALAIVVALAFAVALSLRRRRRPAGELAPRPSTVERLRSALGATRDRLAARVDAALGGAIPDLDRTLAELEEGLVAADVGVRTSAEIVARVRARVGRDAGADEIRRVLREEIEKMLAADA